MTPSQKLALFNRVFDLKSELSASQKDEVDIIIASYEEEVQRLNKIIEKIKLSLCDSEIGKLINEKQLDDLGSDEAMGAMIFAGHIRNYLNGLTK